MTPKEKAYFRILEVRKHLNKEIDQILQDLASDLPKKPVRKKSLSCREVLGKGETHAPKRSRSRNG